MAGEYSTTRPPMLHGERVKRKHYNICIDAAPSSISIVLVLRVNFADSVQSKLLNTSLSMIITSKSVERLS